MESELRRPVSAGEISTYQRDGVVVLRDIYPLARVDQLREAMDEVFSRSDPSRRSVETGASTTGSTSDMASLATQMLVDDSVVGDLISM